MYVLGIDLGGTKIAFSVISTRSEVFSEHREYLGNRTGQIVGQLITRQIFHMIRKAKEECHIDIHAIGVSVPGMIRRQTGTVWAPNIKG